MNALTFEQLDQGINQHKIIILALYFLFLITWYIANRKFHTLFFRPRALQGNALQTQTAK